MKIAIVDDSSSVRMMISVCLEDLGIEEDEITEFSSSLQALEDFDTNFYDLIFCDLHMPNMNGDILVEKIHKHIEHLQSARIVMVSGEEDPNYKKTFKSFGVHQFIKKPIQPASFLHHIKPLIQKIKRNELKNG
jgi:CheY-like chemotaxis protein